MSTRLARRAALATYLLALLAVTLTPTSDSMTFVLSDVSACFICGDRGLADAILNVFLFVPLGVLLVPEVGARRAALAGALLSLTIEVLQTGIPGRHPSLADLLYNGTGAVVGAYLVPIAVGAARSRVTSSRAMVGWVTLCALSLALTGIAFTPNVTDEPLYGQWTPDRGGAVYQGKVVEAWVDGVRVPSYLVPDRDMEAVRGALAERARVSVRFVAGPGPARVAAVFNVFDGARNRILSLGAHGPDLVLDRRYLADRLALDRSTLAVRGAMKAHAPGDTVTVEIEGLRGGGERVSLNGAVHDVGHTIGRGWSLLLFPYFVPDWVKTAADLGWLLAMGIPLGILGTKRNHRLIATGVLLGVLALVPAVTPLVPTPWFQYAALVAGVALGSVLRPLATRFA